MNKILKKILCTALPFSLGCSFSCAMYDDGIVPVDFANNLLVGNTRNRINYGKEAGIFHSETYFPQYVLKLYSKEYSGYLDGTSTHRQGCLSKTNYKALKSLMNKPLGENLVRVIDVNKSGNYIVLEYIDGKTYKEIKSQGLKNGDNEEEIKLTLDFFIDKWCIGIMKGLKQLYDRTGKYLTDRHDENLMIKFISDNEPIPVIIDYDFQVKKPPCFKEFGEIFLEVMEYNINDNDKQDERYEILKNYITQKNNSKHPFCLKQKNVEKVINDLQEIKKGNHI